MMRATRRDFLKLVTVAGGAAALEPVRALASRYQTTGYFGLHPFIESHPEAVFIMRTNVDQKMNSEANQLAGQAFGRSVFVPRDSSGAPVNTSIPVKPNFKTASPTSYKLEDIIGHVPNPFFLEGMFGSMKELGIQGKQFHLREVNRPGAWQGYGIVDMVNRAVLDLRLDLEPTVTNLQAGRDFNWIDVPNGVFWKRIPYLEPINT
ncbi:MAG: twin-arginine translocation signal domain-containing protein, partial [Candidatus Latescibacterota bacterium]